MHTSLGKTAIGKTAHGDYIFDMEQCTPMELWQVHASRAQRQGAPVARGVLGLLPPPRPPVAKLAAPRTRASGAPATARSTPPRAWVPDMRAVSSAASTDATVCCVICHSLQCIFCNFLQR